MKLLVTTGGAGYVGSVGDHGWKPEKPELEAMISDAWDWMQAHPNGYE